jgi:hypothetical protein
MKIRNIMHGFLFVASAGCTTTGGSWLGNDEPAPTQQVPASPFADPRKPAPTRVNYAPASKETSDRVLIIKDQLINHNPQLGLQPFALAIGSADPEIFHVGNTIYITEGLVRMCGTNESLAAALAYEMGRMVAEREATVTDDVRSPDRLPPIDLRIGNNTNMSEANPLAQVELVRFEKARQRPAGKLPPPNPQFVARAVLERAGYQRTDLDAVLPALQNADRFKSMENQFKGNQKDGPWKIQ